MELAAVGDNCIDFYTDTNKSYAGGNPVNVAVYYKRLGGQSSYTGVVGTDSYGDFMIDKISSTGVDVSNLKKVDGKTAVTNVSIVNGERVFGEYDEGVLKYFKLSNEDIDFICNHKIIVTGLWGNVHNYLETFKNKGLIVAFDSATETDSEYSIIAIKSCDYFFFASDSCFDESLRNKMIELKSRGASYIIVTLGENGSVCYDGKEFTQYGIVKCNVVDTMGAGDSYIAGFLKGVMENKSIKSCMEMGAKCASVTLGYSGAW